MSKARDLEGLVYHEKLIYKAWLDKVIIMGHQPSGPAADIVSETLIMYFDAISTHSPYEDDLRNSASELANLVLGDLNIEEALIIYHANLVATMATFMGDHTPASQWQHLIRFSNVLSNEFWRINTDILRKSIRHERAKAFNGELVLAKTIQSHLLPKVIPQIPGFDFAGRLIPAADVGGDYWSIKHYEEDGIVTMKVADISGHGVAAATLVAAVKFISGGYYRNSRSAAEVMRQTNRTLTRETPHDILISMIYAWLCPATFEITLVNAGHEPVFICSGNSCAIVSPTGPVLGVTESAEYSETTFRLEKGDVIFFGSDGITEAGVGKMFGMERLKELVMENKHLSAAELADTVVAAVRNYSPASINDDISLLVTKVTGDPPARA